MISDVLSDAIKQIEEYQKELPKCYDDIRPQINYVKMIMNNLRIELDTPFSKKMRFLPMKHV